MQEWTQILALFVGNAALIAWFRAESRADWRHTDNHIRAIHDEIKDFHVRMCAIEERNKGNRE